MDSRTPRTSSRSGRGSFDSGTRIPTAITPTMTTGTLTRKTEPHQKPACSRAPPVIGPIATAMPVAPAQIPMALPRSAGSKTLVMIDRVAGRTAAPPMPISARIAMSISGDVEYAEASEAAPNRARPSMRMRLRPYRSPSTPQVNSRPANTSV